jgi:hypothetical protein
MVEPFYTVFRILHIGGGWVAFIAAPLALLAVKGSRHHILAGRCFALGLGVGATAGVLLAAIRPDPDYGLLFLGLGTLFAVGTGYLAPQIGRGSRPAYRWDRLLTAVGALACISLIVHGLTSTPFGVSFQEGALYGTLGLWLAGAHARWRGPSDPARWQVEHLTSVLAAYTVVWLFITFLYITVLPQTARVLIPAALGTMAILWARRRFEVRRVPQTPATGPLPGAA